MKKKLLILAAAFWMGLSLSAADTERKACTAVDSNGYKYEYVTNDPFHARIYKLKNGLTVYLSRNDRVPKIYSVMGVRAGSMDEPSDATGLAHYFEHMMFKGTSKIGSLDWEKEKPMLDKLNELFEKYRASNDPEEKKNIYKEIDRISGEAAKLAVAGEYDKIITSLGGSVNAFTSNDMTAFVADLPANELDKFLKLESERLSNPRLRLFHTELETVFEEFNMGQDSDWRQAYEALFRELFPKHPYRRSVIGLPEHLKNPSMKRISEFVSSYYVPNNMLFALAGDLDYEKTIKTVDKLFGKIPSKELPESKSVKENPITTSLSVDIYGPDAESVLFAFRFEKTPRNEDMILLFSNLLTDRGAGIMDCDLVRAQKVLQAHNSPYVMRDYIVDFFSGRPRNGQSLEDVKSLMFNEIDKIKKGDFEEWRIKAIIDNIKMDEAKMVDSNAGVDYNYLNCFITQDTYERTLNLCERLSKITKNDIIEFANSNFKDNYAVVFKKTGKAEGRVKIAKPSITPVDLNRDKHSKYYNDFMALPPSPELNPRFIDFSKDMSQREISKGLKYFYIKNLRNNQFSLHYVVQAGKFHNQKLPLAFGYLSYLGTDKLSADQLRQEFYKQAIDFGAWSENERSIVRVSGLGEKLPEAVRLLNLFISDAKADKEAYEKYIDGILKNRKDAKLNKWAIQEHMRNYGWYGAENPATYLIPEEELKNIDPSELVNLAKDYLTNFEKDVVYWGPDDMDKTSQTVFASSDKTKELKDPGKPKEFIPAEVEKPKVYLLDYDSVQAFVSAVARESIFDIRNAAFTSVFNEYFGYGLTSVFFQEIRESRGLAYMAYSMYMRSNEKGKYDRFMCSLSTQPDKLHDAVTASYKILDAMPESDAQFLASKEAVLKSIRSRRVMGADIFFSYLTAEKMGIDHDWTRDIYENTEKMTITELNAFFKKEIAGKKKNLTIIGNLKNIDRKMLEEFGEVKELKLEEIFGY